MNSRSFRPEAKSKCLMVPFAARQAWSPAHAANRFGLRYVTPAPTTIEARTALTSMGLSVAAASLAQRMDFSRALNSGEAAAAHELEQRGAVGLPRLSRGPAEALAVYMDWLRIAAEGLAAGHTHMARQDCWRRWRRFIGGCCITSSLRAEEHDMLITDRLRGKSPLRSSMAVRAGRDLGGGR